MSKKVFIIEDDSIYQEFLQKNLRTKYNIYAYHNAKDAIMAFKSIKPDVLVIDYKLPGMNGIELFEEIKDNIGSSKVIIMSAIDDGNLVLDFIKKGIRDYVIKDEDIIESLVSIIEDNDSIYYNSGLDD